MSDPVSDPSSDPVREPASGPVPDLTARLDGLGPAPAYPAPDDAVKVSAAWLIERAGFDKGHGIQRATGVRISTKHTLALTNRGGGTAAALLELAREVRNGVERRFGVTLHPEPVLVGCVL